MTQPRRTTSRSRAASASRKRTTSASRKRATSASRKRTTPASRGRSSSSNKNIDRLNKSLDAAQKALKDLRDDAGTGAKDLYSTFSKSLTQARRDSSKLAKALQRDLEKGAKRTASAARGRATGGRSTARRTTARKASSGRSTARRATGARSTARRSSSGRATSRRRTS